MTQAYLQSREGIRGQYSAAIDRLFSDWDRDASPGAIVAVMQAGEVIHQSGYGLANVENDVPFTADTVLRLGSTSKHLGATAVLVLENKGLLSLDDDIRRYVPELPDYGTIITLRHLLNMTSGLWDGLNILLFAGLDPTTAVSRERMLQSFCAQKTLMFKPGDDTTYSNTNYSLISLVIERVSGSSLARFMHSELFQPLGMHSSALVASMEQTVARKAKGYQPAADGLFEAGFMRVELDCNGGVDSSISDMLKWLRNYRDDQHFGPNYRPRMEAENRLNDGRLLDYRLGIEVKDYRGMQVVRHAGGMPGYLCDFVYLPESDVGLVMFTNLLDPQMLRLPDRIADIVLEHGFPQTHASMYVDARRDDVAALVGVYADAESAQVVELTRIDNHLVCFVLGDYNELIEKDGWLRSRKNQISIRAVAVQNGLASGKVHPGAASADDSTTASALIELRLGCQPLFRLHRVVDPREHATAEMVDQSPVGDYYNKDIGEAHIVSVVDGKLSITLPSPFRTLVWREISCIAEDLYVAIIADEPSCTNVVIQFSRDDEGVIDSLNYSINRCRNVRFAKMPGKL